MGMVSQPLRARMGNEIRIESMRHSKSPTVPRLERDPLAALWAPMLFHETTNVFPNPTPDP